MARFANTDLNHKNWMHSYRYNIAITGIDQYG